MRPRGRDINLDLEGPSRPPSFANQTITHKGSSVGLLFPDFGVVVAVQVEAAGGSAIRLYTGASLVSLCFGLRPHRSSTRS